MLMEALVKSKLKLDVLYNGFEVLKTAITLDNCDDIDDNYLVHWVGSNNKQKLMPDIAKVAGKPVKELFPTYIDPRALVSQQPAPMMVTFKCDNDHSVVTAETYIQVICPYYLVTGRKWAGISCRTCDKVIPAEGKLKVSSKNPFWICTNYHLDKCGCFNDGAVCNGCFANANKENASSRRPRKRKSPSSSDISPAATSPCTVG